MVFVSTLLIFSLIVLVGIMVLNIVVAYYETISMLFLKNKFFEQIRKGIYLNTVYIYILFFLLAINTTTSYALAAITFTLMSYFHSNLWAVWMEKNLTTMPLHIRKPSLKRLLSENCVITHSNFYRYFYDLVLTEFSNFQTMIADSIQDFKVAFYLVEPNIVLTQAQKDLYNFQKKFFKYKKVDEFINSLDNKTDEEIIELHNLFKRARDPKERFNSVRRLPWKLKYNEDFNPFFKLLTSNFVVIYNFFKSTLVAVLLMIVYFLYTIFFFKIQFLKQLSVWFVIGMIYFWLMSGFNFFLKRYQYGKFTSQIQRFWKRTNTYFWLIEGFLILLFFYYYLNSSQEPLYMYDYSALNQEYLVSLHVAGTNIILLSLVIYFMYFVMLRLNSNSWVQLSLYLIIISSFIFFSFFIETYQFYYVVSVFNERLWVFNEEENLWGVDIDNPILRTKHQYLLVCLIAKYWHFLFIFLSWVFFLIKSFERKKVTYVLFGANLQNMIILYVLNFACYLQWFKWIYRRFFDLPYTWFFINVDNKFLFRLFFEIKLVALNFCKINPSFSRFQQITYKSLSLWNVDSLCMWKFL